MESRGDLVKQKQSLSSLNVCFPRPPFILPTIHDVVCLPSEGRGKRGAVQEKKGKKGCEGAPVWSGRGKGEGRSPGVVESGRGAFSSLVPEESSARDARLTRVPAQQHLGRRRG